MAELISLDVVLFSGFAQSIRSYVYVYYIWRTSICTQMYNKYRIIVQGVQVTSGVRFVIDHGQLGINTIYACDIYI